MVTTAHTVHLTEGSYDLLVREARRRGVSPDTLADELLRTDLTTSGGDIEQALAGLAQLRGRLPEIDGVTLAREARTDLERRSA